MSSTKLFLKTVPESNSGEFELVIRDGKVLPYGGNMAIGDEIYIGNPLSGDLHGYSLIQNYDSDEKYIVGKKMLNDEISLLAVAQFQGVCEDIALSLSEFKIGEFSSAKRCWDFEGVTRNLLYNECYLHIGGIVDNAYADMQEDKGSEHYTGESDYVSVYPGLVIAKKAVGSFEFAIVYSVNQEENTYQVRHVTEQFLAELFSPNFYLVELKGQLLDNAA